MRDKYRALYDVNIKKQGRDMILTKKLRGLQNDLLNEKIILEKARIDETDELNKLQNVENERDEMQKDVKIIEQRDLMVKFELAELKKVHADLVESLAAMRKENKNLVEPVLAGLKKLVCFHSYRWFLYRISSPGWRFIIYILSCFLDRWLIKTLSFSRSTTLSKKRAQQRKRSLID